MFDHRHIYRPIFTQSEFDAIRYNYTVIRKYELNVSPLTASPKKMKTLFQINIHSKHLSKEAIEQEICDYATFKFGLTKFPYAETNKGTVIIALHDYAQKIMKLAGQTQDQKDLLKAKKYYQYIRILTPPNPLTNKYKVDALFRLGTFDYNSIGYAAPQYDLAREKFYEALAFKEIIHEVRMKYLNQLNHMDLHHKGSLKAPLNIQLQQMKCIMTSPKQPLEARRNATFQQFVIAQAMYPDLDYYQDIYKLLSPETLFTPLSLKILNYLGQKDFDRKELDKSLGKLTFIEQAPIVDKTMKTKCYFNLGILFKEYGDNYKKL
jgi:hypothetical protein